MKYFKELDYFRKPKFPELIRPSFLGGIISILCITVCNKELIYKIYKAYKFDLNIDIIPGDIHRISRFYKL
jgi:hypothetical protein